MKTDFWGATANMTYQGFLLEVLAKDQQSHFRTHPEFFLFCFFLLSSWRPSVFTHFFNSSKKKKRRSKRNIKESKDVFGSRMDVNNGSIEFLLSPLSSHSPFGQGSLSINYIRSKNIYDRTKERMKFIFSSVGASQLKSLFFDFERISCCLKGKNGFWISLDSRECVSSCLWSKLMFLPEKKKTTTSCLKFIKTFSSLLGTMIRHFWSFIFLSETTLLVQWNLSASLRHSSLHSLTLSHIICWRKTNRLAVGKTLPDFQARQMKVSRLKQNLWISSMKPKLFSKNVHKKNWSTLEREDFKLWLIILFLQMRKPIEWKRLQNFKARPTR